MSLSIATTTTTSSSSSSDGSKIVWGFMFENTLFTEFERRNHPIIEAAYRQRKKKHSSHHITIVDSNLPKPGKAKVYFGVAQNHLRMPGTRYAYTITYIYYFIIFIFFIFGYVICKSSTITATTRIAWSTKSNVTSTTSNVVIPTTTISITICTFKLLPITTIFLSTTTTTTTRTT
ncbi:hypothetical protein BDF21DRAFT_406907, partial [Thamnidium elegans]